MTIRSTVTWRRVEGGAGACGALAMKPCVARSPKERAQSLARWPAAGGAKLSDRLKAGEENPDAGEV